MPQLGETVTEGTITRWFKAVGDAVARDEPLFEVSTDKVDSEVPSPAAGTLAEIRVPEGETVDVGSVLAVISEGATGPGAGTASPPPVTGEAPGGGSPAATLDGPAEETPAAAPAPSAPEQPPAPGASPASPPPAAAPGAPAPLAASAPPATAPGGEGAAGGAGAAGAGGAVGAVGAARGDGSAGSSPLLLSPVVRRLLADNGIEPSEVRGTGPGGRITRDDVLAVVDARRSGGAPAGAVVSRSATVAAPSPAAPVAVPAAGGAATSGAGATGEAGLARAAPPLPGQGAGDEDVFVPFTNIRRRTAEHMVRSKATSAHTLVVTDADFEAVERVRRAHGERFRAEEGFALTYLPFVARATVDALHRWPHLNASVGEDALVVHRRVHLGIAVDLGFEGLVAPVVHGADELTVRGLARRIRDLADRARSKRLGPDDLSGGTFTITNPGPFGTLLTGPIINQPQIGILSTDSVKRRPVAVTLDDGSEAVAIHSVGYLSLTWDHRAVDGAYAAAFLHDIADVLARHDWMAEL